MQAITNFFDKMVQRFLPDAYLFAVILTIIVFVLGMAIESSTPTEMVQYWGNGFWSLLTFAMQMSLIVVTGYILANTPFVKGILQGLAALAKTPGQAIILVTLVGTIGSLINYGFGLVVGALMAIAVVKRVPTVDFRLLVASAYTGFLVWHGGLSGSVPLLIATDGHFLVDQIGTVPVTQTLFSTFNIFIVAFLVVTLPIVNRLMLKGHAGDQFVDTVKFDDPPPSETKPKKEMTPAERMENSRVLTLIIGLLGLAYIFYHFSTKGFDLNINVVNFIMLFLGILLHGTPKRFLDCANDSVKSVSGIIIQFPFYAGIMGMMTSSGLSETMSLWFVSISNEVTFPLFTFLSAGLVNVFVPSGGGQWAVQGPIMLSAGMEIGVDTARTAMAVAWGDAWTNMIQPFWALPLLGIAGLRIRDIMGFCTIVLIYSFFPIAIGLMFL